MDDAASLAGIKLNEPALDVPAPAKTVRKPRTQTVSGEISDPPKSRKIVREEVQAEAKAVAEAAVRTGVARI